MDIHRTCRSPSRCRLPGFQVAAPAPAPAPAGLFLGRVLTRFYIVPESTPMLPTLPILVEEMNATRDFYGFLRRVREAFCEQLKRGES